MSKKKMRSKEEIINQVEFGAYPDLKTREDDIQLGLLEALLDIRDILDEREEEETIVVPIPLKPKPSLIALQTEENVKEEKKGE